MTNLIRTRSEATGGRAPASGQARFPGVYLLLFPLLALGLGIAWLQNRPRERGSFPDPPEKTEQQLVSTWTGASASQALLIRFSRLHASAERQAFDSRVLRERFELTEGEPWQIELAADAAADKVVDLSSLHIVGDDDARLEPVRLEQESKSFPGMLALDPVETMLNTPRELHPGERLRFVLWGTDPGESAELLGLGSAIALERQSLPHREGPIVARVTEGAVEVEGQQ